MRWCDTCNEKERGRVAVELMQQLFPALYRILQLVQQGRAGEGRGGQGRAGEGRGGEEGLLTSLT